MKITDLIKLIILAAIWGSSFIYMRILAPVLGAIPTANLRVLIAGIVLTLYLRAIKFDSNWKKNGLQYLLIGLLGSGIPFSLFSYAALNIPASYEVILNSTAPMFGALFAWIWLGEKMTLLKIVGLVLAAVGCGIVVNIGAANITRPFIFSVLACLLAAICYGLTGIYVKKCTKNLKPKAIAGGSQLMVGLMMIPFSLLQKPNLNHLTNPKILFCVLALALICSAIAYLLYYQLLADVGPTKALTVTFLMPIFGIFWGAIFLHEMITFQMICGTIIILIGTWLVVKPK